jgi:hypothetical protein
MMLCGTYLSTNKNKFKNPNNLNYINMNEQTFTTKDGKVVITNPYKALEFLSDNFIIHFGNPDTNGRAEWKLFKLIDVNTPDVKIYADGNINFISNWAHVSNSTPLEAFLDDFEIGGIDESLVRMIESRADDCTLLNEPKLRYEDYFTF